MGEYFTDEQFRQAIPKSGGIITTIADRVGCSWHTASRRIKQTPELNDLFEHEANKIDDLAESVVIKAMQAGDVATAKWWLERRRRGVYSTRQELAPALDVNGEAIPFRVIDYRLDLESMGRIIEGQTVEDSDELPVESGPLLVGGE